MTPPRLTSDHRSVCIVLTIIANTLITMIVTAHHGDGVTSSPLNRERWKITRPRASASTMASATSLNGSWIAFHIVSVRIKKAASVFGKTIQELIVPTTNQRRRKMNNEDYVSYELAKKLKACGFCEPCDHYYHIKNGVPEDDMWFTHGSCADFNNYKRRPDDFVSVPFLWQAQKWLREGKRCDVTVYAQPYNGLPFYTGYILFEGDETEVLDDNGQWFDDYEKALSETIASALELIEQENK